MRSLKKLEQTINEIDSINRSISEISQSRLKSLREILGTGTFALPTDGDLYNECVGEGALVDPKLYLCLSSWCALYIRHGEKCAYCDNTRYDCVDGCKRTTITITITEKIFQLLLDRFLEEKAAELAESQAVLKKMGAE